MIPIFVSLALVALFVLLYRKERNTPGFKTPTIIRLVILIIIILVTIGNIFRVSYNQSPKVPVLVLVDASKSINIGNNTATIKRVIDKIEKEQLKNKFFSFSDSIGPLADYEKATGKRTDISQALSFAQTKRPGAIILISDGEQNTRTDPTITARSISSPIYTIGIGDEQKQDVLIQSIRKPAKSFLGDSISITSRIQSYGYENQKTKINLLHKGKVISAQDIILNGKDALQEITFSVLPETTGRLNYTIKIDNLPAEASYSNNQKDLSVEVMKNRWHIVYLTNTPSFNTRFLVSTIENSSSLETKTSNNFVVTPIVSFTGKDFQALNAVPINKAFQDADVIILDNINEDNLTSDIITQLRNALDKGAGFLVLTGDNFKPRTFVKDILPFDFNTSSIQKKDIFTELTETGIAAPVFFNATGAYLLDNAPPFWGINQVLSVKPEAVLWADSKDDKKPLIGYRQYKNSKIVCMTAFPLWRLGFSSIDPDNQKLRFEQFTKNLLRFLAIHQFDAFKLVTDKPDYLTGDDIIFDLSATTPDGRAWTDLDVKIEIPEYKIIQPLFETSPGTYEGNAEALTAGDYNAIATVSKDNKIIGKTQTTFSVGQQSIEDITGLNSGLLMKLSDITNGKYYTAEQIIKDGITPNLIRYKRTLSFSFRNNYYIYIIITILFGATLFLRKKRGFL